MTRRVPTSPVLWIAALVLVSLLSAAWLYILADSQTRLSILQEAAGLFIQLATLVALGALIKYGVDEVVKAKEKRIADREFQVELVRRTRSIHHTVRGAPFFIEQKKTVEEYNLQMRNLLDVASELKDLGDDIRSSRLSTDNDSRATSIGKDIQAMISYLYSLLSEAASNPVSRWEDVIALHRYGEYRDAALKFGQPRSSDNTYMVEYDQHYESLKHTLRDIVQASSWR